MRIFALLSALFFISYGCGSGSSEKEDPPADPAFDNISGVVQASCGGCHNGRGSLAKFTAANFKSSASKVRIKNGSMPPPPRVLSEGDKEALLGYLG